MKRIQFLAAILSLSFLFFVSFRTSSQDYWFKTGQDADILLSGIDFNQTGGALLFNHPMNIATDGKRLLLADTRNNRILIWNSIPDGNVEPDLVLGQDNFTTNNPGSGLNRLNWPVGVTAAQEKVVVADTYNNRILIWNTFPTANAQPADLYINFSHLDPKERIEWPWDVWTDGTKLIVTSTIGGTVLIYNSFPVSNNQRADLYLKGKNPGDGTDRFGTPRTIGTDGKSYLVIGDHNAKGETSISGNFFWNSFPSMDNQPYDFFMANPVDPNQMMWGGVKTNEGRFITVAPPGIAIWNTVPRSVVPPDLFVGRAGGPCDQTGYYFNDGDGSDLALTPSGKLFISLYNGNKVVAFNFLPVSESQCPDFAIGAPDIDTNTLDTNYIITNGVPATNGTNLFVSSDFDKKLYVWKTIPEESGKHPDTVYVLDFEPWDNALYNDNFVLAGRQTIQIWKKLPLDGNKADITFNGQIGSVSFKNIMGVALDSKYLYIADSGAGKLYVWSALPESNSSPLFTLDLNGITRLSSDGRYLTVVLINDNKVQIYDVSNLSSSSLPLAEISRVSNQPGHYSYINLPQGALVAGNHLFIADTNFSRVFCWESVEDAIKGNFPDVVLGKKDYTTVSPGIGVNSLFWPGGLAFHRNRLWVGEFKFSGRLVGFKHEIEPVPPTVSTGSASSVTSSSATLNGTVNPQGQSTEYYFEYGTSVSYGSKTPGKSAGSGTGDVSVSAEITGLTPGTTYHFRLVAKNSVGTSYGENKNFTTEAAKEKPGGGEEGGGGKCFIATACFETPMADEVKILRAFRDEYLLSNPAGRAMMDLYYVVSPGVADFIRQRESLKMIVRVMLKPAVRIVDKLVDQKSNSCKGEGRR